MTKALVPGTFDPITSGHLEVVEHAAALFDEVVVCVAASKNKGSGPLFSLEERVALAKEATKDMPNVTVQPFSKLLVDFARELEADVIVKGLRALTDFEHEFQMAALNRRGTNNIETLFFMASPDYMYLSSSMVKEIASMNGSVEGLVPRCVVEALRKRFS